MILFEVIYLDKTWASGAIELLKHANEHIDKASAFDKRMAFISIDNAIEVSIRTYLSLPKQFFSSSRPSRDELDKAYNNFTELLNLLTKYAKNRLTGLEVVDIEHYHRIRNKLYHEGTGLSVDEEYLNAYFAVAKVLLKRLFDVEFNDQDSSNYEANLGELVLVWNEIEESLNKRFLVANIDKAHTYKWEEAVQKGILTYGLIQDLTELRMSRNRAVHSNALDTLDLQNTLRKAKKIRDKLKI